MSAPLHILLVCCGDDAAAAVLAELAKEYEPLAERAGSYEGVRQMLLSGDLDLVVVPADAELSPEGVLAEITEFGSDVPLAVLCDAATETSALDAVRAGAAEAVRLDDPRRLLAALVRERRAAGRRSLAHAGGPGSWPAVDPQAGWFAGAGERERRRIEQTLRETELHFQELFEHTSDAVAVFAARRDGTWVCETMNPACERATGLRAADCVGRRADDLVAGEAARELAVGFRACRAGDAVVTREHPLDLPSGRRWFNTVLVPLPDQDGRVRRLACIARDITEHRDAEDRLRSSEQRRRAHLEHTPLGAVEWDAGGRIVGWNAAAERIFGHPAAVALGRPFAFVIAPDARAEVEACRARMLTGEDGGCAALTCVARDGRRIDTEWYYTRLTDAGGAYAGAAALVADVTEHNRAVAEVRRLNAGLEHCVADRTAQLRAANQELEAFCYSVSHDLRAPLRAIDGFSQALLEDYSGRLGDDGRDYLTRVRAATRRMGELIDDLLELSRVARAELRRTRVDLSALARQVAERLHATRPERRVEWVIAPGLEAEGDRNLLTIVMENLLGNAFKYTGRKLAARIEFGGYLHQGTTVFFVRDDGAGFDPAYAGKLFQPFQRLHRNDEFEGHGIGLATVLRIVRRHGGRAWAEGAADCGATFYFTLGEDLSGQQNPSGSGPGGACVAPDTEQS